MTTLNFMLSINKGSIQSQWFIHEGFVNSLLNDRDDIIVMIGEEVAITDETIAKNPRFMRGDIAKAVALAKEKKDESGSICYFIDPLSDPLSYLEEEDNGSFYLMINEDEAVPYPLLGAVLLSRITTVHGNYCDGSDVAVKATVKTSLGKVSFNATKLDQVFSVLMVTKISEMKSADDGNIDLSELSDVFLACPSDMRLAFASLLFWSVIPNQDENWGTEEQLTGPISEEGGYIGEDLSAFYRGKYSGGGNQGFFNENWNKRYGVFDVIWPAGGMLRLSVSSAVNEPEIILHHTSAEYDQKTKGSIIEKPADGNLVLTGNKLAMFYLEVTHSVKDRPRSLLKHPSLLNACVIESIIADRLWRKPAANI